MLSRFPRKRTWCERSCVLHSSANNEGNNGTGMSFIWPTLLLALIFVPLLVFLYVRMQARRRTFAARYGSLGLVHDAAGAGIGFRRHIPALIFLAGISI